MICRRSTSSLLEVGQSLGAHRQTPKIKWVVVARPRRCFMSRAASLVWCRVDDGQDPSLHRLRALTWRVVNAGAGRAQVAARAGSPAWSPRQPAPSPAKPHTAFDAFAHMPANPFSPKLAAKKKSPKLAMRPPDHHPPGWAPPRLIPGPRRRRSMLSRAPDGAAPPPPMPSHTPVKDDNGGDPWPAGSADPVAAARAATDGAAADLAAARPDAPRRRCQHIRPKSLQKSQNNGRRTGSRRRRQKQRDRSRPAPSARRTPDEIDSDDSDDDEREWSLRHALDEFGVTKVRVKGKQGARVILPQKRTRHALHAHRLGAWRLSKSTTGLRRRRQGASSPQVEHDPPAAPRGWGHHNDRKNSTLFRWQASKLVR